ncbi:nitroreductase family protein [Neisseria wadsworthii]|uniref:nitroreductase family protein n=1 Tax=Neisseria wadsworthii TaxID=607711 RepID=UPI000D310F42|nr:nitroreductase family protein [Neisseria wadsworthii]
MQAAAVIVISGKLTGYQDLNEKLQASVQTGIIDNDTAQNWISAAYAAFHDNPRAQRDEAIRSASLAAMTLMLAAQEQGWASCPMSGLDTEAVRQTAGLSENLLPVLLVAIGKTDGRQKQKIRAQVEWSVI